MGSGDAPLHAELPEMMIDVLVHEDGPLLRFERTEEGVRVSVHMDCRGAAICIMRGVRRFVDLSMKLARELVMDWRW